MLKSCARRFRSSLTARIFLITALILFAACGATYLFMAWATPISYRSLETDLLEELAHELAWRLGTTTLEDSGPLFDRFRLDTGAEVQVTDQDGSRVTLPTALVAVSESDSASDTVVEATGNSETVLTTRPGVTAGPSAGTAAADDVSASGGGDVGVAAAEGTAQGTAGGGDEVEEFTTPFSITSSVTVSDQEDSGWFFSNTSVSISSSSWEVPFSFEDDPHAVYTLKVIARVTAVNQAAEAMGRVLPYLVPVVLLISLAGALFYSRYITKPIVRLSGVSQKMAELDFTWKGREQRSDEIGVLGRNLNQLSESLSAALSDLQTANAALQRDIDRERELELQRSTFFAAASHELKTPITVLKGQLSGMLAGVDVYRDRDKYLARSLAVAGRMEKLVREMLTVSRMERDGFSIKREAVDLSALVREQAAQAEDLAMQRGQRMALSVEPGVRVEGDGALLERAVSNLLGNALTHAAEGSAVAVRLSAGAGRPVLEVENGGAQIPKDALPHIFEAFYRVDASRSRDTGGSGLGLYLVKMILDRHGAACRIENHGANVRATVIFAGDLAVSTQTPQ